jgi:WhiB family redox-sensing transcriptional regulator
LKPDYSQAACKGVDTHLFYPEVIGDRGKKMKMKEPIKICAVCPIQMDCLIHACETGEFWGVWGGVSERRRKQLAESKEYHLWAVRDCITCSQKFMPTVQTQFNCGPKCFQVYNKEKNRIRSAARRKSKASN